MTSKLERVLAAAEALTAANPAPLTEAESAHLIRCSSVLCPACLSYIARADRMTARAS